MLLGEGHRLPVRLHEVTGEEVGDFPPSIENDIELEIQARQARGLLDVEAHDIHVVVAEPGRMPRAGLHVEVIVGDAVDVRNAGQYDLSPAGESRLRMGRHAADADF